MASFTAPRSAKFYELLWNIMASFIVFMTANSNEFVWNTLASFTALMKAKSNECGRRWPASPRLPMATKSDEFVWNTVRVANFTGPTMAKSESERRGLAISGSDERFAYGP